MGAITLTPEVFEKVFYTNDGVVSSCEAVVAMVPGAAALGDISIHINEDRPTNRVRIGSMDPLTLELESGSLEDTANPRKFSDLQTQINVGRLLFEALDRADDAFGAPDLDAVPGTGVRGAWEIYCFGRVHRLGLRMHKPRYLYNFHNWVGFSDAATEAFNALWDGQGLSFADVESHVAELTPTRTI